MAAVPEQSYVSHEHPNVARTYHKTAAAYVLPNDSLEQDRLDTQAAAIVEMIGGRTFLAPIKSPLMDISKAVDIGCGTGVATMQMGKVLPDAEVYGLDLSPIPAVVKQAAPANVSWMQGNILDIDFDEKVFAPRSVDYIFGRMLFLGINDWAKYFITAARTLKSGGIIEHQDLDYPFYRTGTDTRIDTEWSWVEPAIKGFEKAGLSTTAGSGAAALMEAAGLEIVSRKTFEWSLVATDSVPNSKRMASYAQEKLVPQYPDILRKLLESQNIRGEEFEEMTRQAQRDVLSEEGIHQKYTVTVARKR